ncbi:MAG: ankyrin repeat domain-containing protein [Gammaproteobacteria bacterium]|nr:ankyrin repeat domain-containing protein [Gammaproteobacteria bacterium]
MNLIDAVVEGDTKKVKELLAGGEDPSLVLDAAQVTPLHYAAQFNAVEIGKLLIKAGANIYARTSPEEETPLEIAHLHDSKEFIKLLLSHILRDKDGANYIN